MRTSMGYLSIVGLLFLLAGAAPATAQQEGCSYCAGPWSCVPEDGTGPGNHICWVTEWGCTTTYVGPRCEIQQTEDVVLADEDQLDITVPRLGEVRLVRVAGTLFAAWRSCDGHPGIVATVGADGVVRFLPPSTPGIPSYTEWRQLRTGLEVSS